METGKLTKFNVFTGGFKIWECTGDLIKYLEANEKGIQGKTKVLDLGCGSGLLGLYGLHKGADVDFQDYVSFQCMHRFYTMWIYI